MHFCEESGIIETHRVSYYKEEIPMDQNILMNLDEAMKESLEKIFQLLEE